VVFAGQAGVGGAVGTLAVSKRNGKMRESETSVTSLLASVESCEEEKMVLEKRDNGEHCAALQYEVYKLRETCYGLQCEDEGVETRVHT